MPTRMPTSRTEAQAGFTLLELLVVLVILAISATAVMSIGQSSLESARVRSFLVEAEAMFRDARKHVSPNAGWPEAALAGAMDISLGGPRTYQGRFVELPWMGLGRAELTRADIRSGLKIYYRALWVFTALVAMGALIL